MTAAPESRLPNEYAERARLTYEAMQRAMYLADGKSLYRETAAPQDHVAYLWPFSRALQGTLSLAGIRADLLGGVSYQSAVDDRLAGLERYFDAYARVPAYDSAVRPPLGPGGDKYYDDNAWVALSLVQHVRMGGSKSLERVARLFDFAVSGWDRQPRDPLPGGVFWVQQGVGYGQTNHDRGAGASAGSAEIGLHLHELTRSTEYDGDGELTARPRDIGALNMMGWVHRHLDQSGTGRGPYLNLVRRDGSVDTNIWSYNQGVMIGANVLRYRLAGQPGHLRTAEDIARQTLTTFGDFTNHPPTFNAMCFQNLLMLGSVSADQSLADDVVERLRQYVDWAWDPATGARDATTNLFAFDDAGRPARNVEAPRLLDQGALLQLQALLAWHPQDYAHLT